MSLFSVYIKNATRKYTNELFLQKTHGTFVECGAYDGFNMSNTIFLEKERKWSGLLIEADPSNFYKLRQINRKSFTSNTCITEKGYPNKVLNGLLIASKFIRNTVKGYTRKDVV